MSKTQHQEQKAKIEYERAEVARLSRMGLSNVEIMDELGLSWKTVQKHLHKASVRYAQTQRKDYHAMVAECDAKLRDIMKEAFNTWRWSQGKVTNNLAKQVVDIARRVANNEGVAFPETLQLALDVEPLGEFLQMMLDCVKQEMKLKGLGTLKVNQQINNMVGQVVVNWDTLSSPSENGGADDVDKRLNDLENMPQIGLKELAKVNGEGKNGQTI